MEEEECNISKVMWSLFSLAEPDVCTATSQVRQVHLSVLSHNGGNSPSFQPDVLHITPHPSYKMTAANPHT